MWHIETGYARQFEFEPLLPNRALLISLRLILAVVTGVLHSSEEKSLQENIQVPTLQQGVS